MKLLTINKAEFQLLKLCQYVKKHHGCKFKGGRSKFKEIMIFFQSIRLKRENR